MPCLLRPQPHGILVLVTTAGLREPTSIAVRTDRARLSEKGLFAATAASSASQSRSTRSKKVLRRVQGTLGLKTFAGTPFSSGGG